MKTKKNGIIHILNLTDKKPFFVENLLLLF